MNENPKTIPVLAVNPATGRSAWTTTPMPTRGEVAVTLRTLQRDPGTVIPWHGGGKPDGSFAAAGLLVMSGSFTCLNGAGEERTIGKGNFVIFQDVVANAEDAPLTGHQNTVGADEPLVMAIVMFTTPFPLDAFPERESA